MNVPFVLILFLVLLTTTQSALPKPGVKTGTAKWVRINANLVLVTPAEVLSIVDKAKAEGANGVVFADTKIFTWWFRSPGQTWLTRMKTVQAEIKNRNMDFVITGPGIGYCSGVLARDPNLANGYPQQDVPLKVGKSSKLVPVETADIPNGSFEDANGNTPVGWGFQDSPGVTTFIDSSVAHSGSKSLRFDVKPDQLSRLFGTFALEKFQQYTLTVWVKTQDLTAGNILVLVRDGANTERSLTNQALSTPSADGGRKYFTTGNGLTLDWTEMKLAFNSQDATSISLVLGVYSATGGKIWWDDVKINSTPLLNLVRRTSLPLVLKTAGGRVLKEKTDYSGIRDPKLGQSVYQGNYDTYHDAPTVINQAASGLKEGDTVLLSGYHAMVTLRGQVGCSWLENKVFNTIRRMYVEAEKNFPPDGYLLDTNEVRTGGWEPAEVAKGTSGKALAAHFRQEVNVVRGVTKNKPLYLWSDMIDPGHNAVDNYYQVRNTLAGSWNGVDRTKVSIVNWEDTKLKEKAKPSVAFFDNKGYTQVIAAFYDMDVQENYDAWQDGIDGRPVAGSMYTTWVPSGDYSKLKSFGDLWW